MVIIEEESHEITAGGKRIYTTPKEFMIMKLLAQAKGRVIDRSTLMRKAWKDTGGDSRTVDQHVSRLRKKLGTYGKGLVTVTGFGYKAVNPLRIQNVTHPQAIIKQVKREYKGADPVIYLTLEIKGTANYKAGEQVWLQ